MLDFKINLCTLKVMVKKMKRLSDRLEENICKAEDLQLD